jgi:hypothetical protein
VGGDDEEKRSEASRGEGGSSTAKNLIQTGGRWRRGRSAPLGWNAAVEWYEDRRVPPFGSTSGRTQGCYTARVEGEQYAAVLSHARIRPVSVGFHQSFMGIK